MLKFLLSASLASAAPVAAPVANAMPKGDQHGGPAGLDAVAPEAKHEVVHANTLWDLAQHYCKDPWQWPRIYEANKAQIKNPHWIYPGQVFQIPCVGKTVAVYPKAEEPVQAAAPVAEPEPEAPAPASEEPAPKPAVQFDGLSTRLPEGLTEQHLALERLQLPKEWKPDGRVAEFEGHEILAAQGDVVRARLDDPRPAAKGQRFEVYRPAAPTEDDADQEGRYAQKIGVVELQRKASANEFTAVIVRSGTTLQVGDLLKRKAP